MKFDVIVGNPPYQMETGGSGRQAKPVYHVFVQQAKKMRPRYLTMIIPSRWFAGGMGLDEFREEMLNDTRFRKIVDYPISSECFPGVEIKGGICYFLWDRDNKGLCEVITLQNNTISIMTRPLLEEGCDIFIRYNESISILRKVLKKMDTSFTEQVSTQKPFGLRTFCQGKHEHFDGAIKIYTNNGFGYIKSDEVVTNQDWVKKHKIYITMAYGAGEKFPHQILNRPFYGEPNTCCTETYLVIGPYYSKEESLIVLSYIKTRFFRFLVLLRKNTQHAAKGVYSFVPMQDFSEPWTDEKLYQKYGLTQDEIAFIESMIRPMEITEGENV
jgi:site-specific DNA-methyltransferase (adenine-specific)